MEVIHSFHISNHSFRTPHKSAGEPPPACATLQRRVMRFTHFANVMPVSSRNPLQTHPESRLTSSLSSPGSVTLTIKRTRMEPPADFMCLKAKHELFLPALLCGGRFTNSQAQTGFTRLMAKCLPQQQRCKWHHPVLLSPPVPASSRLSFVASTCWDLLYHRQRKQTQKQPSLLQITEPRMLQEV